MENNGMIYDVPMKDIKVSELNVRTSDLKEGIEELAESIREFGLLQPVVIQGEYNQPPYELIIGQRRFLAHKHLKRKSIRAIFLNNTKTETQLKLLSLSENMHRRQLNYADAATVITELYTQFNGNASQVARSIGVSVPTVLDYVNIEAQATEKAKQLLTEKKVSKQDVRRAIHASRGNPDLMDGLLDQFPELNRYEKERAVESGRQGLETVEEIIAEARKPKYQETVVLNLNEETTKALRKAERLLSKTREDIVMEALEQWLNDNSFLGR